MSDLKENLVWIDLEMTGLNPDTDRIIEIATIVTDKDLNVLAEGPVLAVYQPPEVLAAMDEWNTEHHTNSGLVKRVQENGVSEKEAVSQTLDFLQDHTVRGESPLCGNSICQDRRFLWNYMGELEAWFHYRNLDVSSLKILAQKWAPEIADGFKKQNKHEALADIRESIGELRYYREKILTI